MNYYLKVSSVKIFLICRLTNRNLTFGDVTSYANLPRSGGNRLILYYTMKMNTVHFLKTPTLFDHTLRRYVPEDGDRCDNLKSLIQNGDSNTVQ